MQILRIFLGRGVSSHAVGLWQATVGVISGQEAVLQVNHGFADLLVAGQEVMVIDRDFQVLVLRQEACHLEHPKKKTQKCLRRFALYGKCGL